MSKRIEINSNDASSLENLHVVFDAYDKRKVAIQEIYIYCDMMSDWFDITAISIPNKKFITRLTEILEDYLLNLEIEKLNKAGA